jgi:hypothetical protein
MKQETKKGINVFLFAEKFIKHFQFFLVMVLFLVMVQLHRHYLLVQISSQSQHLYIMAIDLHPK